MILTGQVVCVNVCFISLSYKATVTQRHSVVHDTPHPHVGWLNFNPVRKSDSKHWNEEIAGEMIDFFISLHQLQLKNKWNVQPNDHTEVDYVGLVAKMLTRK